MFATLLVAAALAADADQDEDLAKLNPKILQALLDFEKDKRARIDKLVAKKAPKQSIEKVAAETWRGEPAAIPLKTGMVGEFAPGVVVRCDQVVDDENFRGTLRAFTPAGKFAGPPSSSEQSVWFKGYDTSEMQDGQAAALEGLFIVGGTKRYDTAAGGTRQVMILEPLNLEPYYAQLKKQGAIAEVPDLKKKASPETPEQKVEREEKAAAGKLKSAEALRKAGKVEAYRKSLRELVEKYPTTKAADEARALLK